MSKDYRTETELNIINKINEIKCLLPSYVNEYMNNLQRKTTPQTRLGYIRDIQTFLEFVVDADKNYPHNTVKDITLECLNALNLDFFDDYINYLESYEKNGIKRQNSKVSQRRKLSAIKSLYAYLFKTKKLTNNILPLVEPPKVDKKNIVRMDKDEAREYINTVEFGEGKLSSQQKAYYDKYSIRDYALISIFLGTGIRVSELVGLDISDVDIKHCRLNIIRKGKKEDKVYFSDEICETLENYLLYREKIEPFDETHKDALFLSCQRKRISVRGVEKLVKKYAIRANQGNRISPHKLRSTFGTALYEETGDIFLVAETLGHSSVTTTSKFYSEVSDKRKYDNRNRAKY